MKGGDNMKYTKPIVIIYSNLVTAEAKCYSKRYCSMGAGNC